MQNPEGLTDDGLVSGWIAYTVTKDPEAFAAWDTLDQLSCQDIERGWKLVLALVDRVPEEHLPAVGAGPLENLIGHFPEPLGARAPTQAAKDPRFRAALERVWISRSRIPAAVREKLVLATAGRILILK